MYYILLIPYCFFAIHYVIGMLEESSHNDKWKVWMNKIYYINIEKRNCIMVTMELWHLFLQCIAYKLPYNLYKLPLIWVLIYILSSPISIKYGWNYYKYGKIIYIECLRSRK